LDDKGPEVIRLPAQGSSFDIAMRHAGNEAERRCGMVMLLSWKNNLTGAYSPNVEACNSCGLEGWEQYAQSRGAEIRVEVGDDYVFMYKLV
jgi:Domain of unknown function (DUF5619)